MTARQPRASGGSRPRGPRSSRTRSPARSGPGPLPITSAAGTLDGERLRRRASTRRRSRRNRASRRRTRRRTCRPSRSPARARGPGGSRATSRSPTPGQRWRSRDRPADARFAVARSVAIAASAGTPSVGGDRRRAAPARRPRRRASRAIERPSSATNHGLIPVAATMRGLGHAAAKQAEDAPEPVVGRSEEPAQHDRGRRCAGRGGSTRRRPRSRRSSGSDRVGLVLGLVAAW
jgi:hypothetical protein